jgi:anti-sigma B factor antagonist
MNPIVLIRLQPPLETGRAAIYYLTDHEERIDDGPTDKGVKLKEYVHEKLEEQMAKGTRRVIVDLRLIKKVSSTHVGMFLRWHRVVSAQEGEIALVNLSDQVRGVMMVTRLDTILRVFGSVAEAQSYFSDGGS